MASHASFWAGVGSAKALSNQSLVTAEKRATIRAPWPLPAVVVAYHITYDGHPDSYPLHIASKVLSDGQTSRIQQSLVYDKQIAVSAFGGANLIEDPNLFYAVAIVQPGHTPEEAIVALNAELDRLKARIKVETTPTKPAALPEGVVALNEYRDALGA